MRQYSVIKHVLGGQPYLRYFLWIWFITISLFIWLVNINLLVYILGSGILTISDKVGMISSAYVNFFLYIDNPVAVSRAIFSLLIAVNTTLLVYLWRESKKRQGMARKNGGALAVMVGSHCIACGASFAAPLITAVAGSATYFSAERYVASQLLATGAYLIGISVILWSIKSATKNIALIDGLSNADTAARVKIYQPQHSQKGEK